MMPDDFTDEPPADLLNCVGCGMRWTDCLCSPTERAPAADDDGEIARRRAEVARTLRELRKDFDARIGDMLIELEQIEKLERLRRGQRG